MIELVYKGICENCKYRELELSACDLGEEALWDIHCKHEDACKRVEKNTTEKVRNESE